MPEKPDLPDGSPLDRRGLAVGDSVQLIRLDEWFFDNMSDDVVGFLRTCVGRDTTIAEFDEYGHAEIEYKNPNREDGGFHFLWVDPSWLKKV